MKNPISVNKCPPLVKIPNWEQHEIKNHSLFNAQSSCTWHNNHPIKSHIQKIYQKKKLMKTQILPH